jgi:MoaA/NifB/PqqE/SkfB family radical SAM enzyme
MSVRNCLYPWHWMIVTHEGDVLPCGHGSKPVGNLRERTADEIWNGPVMQALRAHLLVGRVHPVCRSTDCPHQQQHLAFTPAQEFPAIDEELARSFDDAWYLDAHPDIAAAVQRRQFASGLEHFAKHGCHEGRAYRLVSAGEAPTPAPSAANATLALLEYVRGATVLRSRPVDLVIQVSTICNLRCVMCPHGTGAVDRPSHMPLAVLERVQHFITTAARMIVSGLGEPLLAPAFWRLVESCAGRDDAFIRANSNALLVTPENAGRLLDSGLKEISFSFDAATPATYARIRGADFARARRGVETVCAVRRTHRRRSLEIFMNMTLMAENIAEAPQFVEMAAEIGVDAVLFSQLFPFGDQPAWRVTRGAWTFAYSAQMLHRLPQRAAEHLGRARARGEALGIRLEFQSNTHLYAATPLTVEPLPQNDPVTPAV